MGVDLTSSRKGAAGCARPSAAFNATRGELTLLIRAIDLTISRRVAIRPWLLAGLPDSSSGSVGIGTDVHEATRAEGATLIVDASSCIDSQGSFHHTQQSRARRTSWTTADRVLTAGDQTGHRFANAVARRFQASETDLIRYTGAAFFVLISPSRYLDAVAGSAELSRSILGTGHAGTSVRSACQPASSANKQGDDGRTRLCRR